MSRRNTKRERIITAAIQLWQDTHNVNKVSLEDIAREACVSPTTIYNNFDTREGLVEEVIKYLTRKMLDQQRTAAKSDLPFPLKMQAMLFAKMTTVKDMHTDLMNKFSTDPIVGNYLDEIYQAEIKPMMMSIIAEGKQQGYIDPDIPDEVIILYLDMMKAGVTAYAGELQGIAGDSRLMTTLIRICYFGLFQKEFDFIALSEQKRRQHEPGHHRRRSYLSLP